MALVRCGGSALNGSHHNAAFVRVEVEENAPIPDPAPEPLLASFEFTDVAQEGIHLHLIDCTANTLALVGRDAFKRLSRGPGDGYEPWFLVCGVHGVWRNHRVGMRPCRDEWPAVRLGWESPRRIDGTRCTCGELPGRVRSESDAPPAWFSRSAQPCLAGVQR